MELDAFWVQATNLGWKISEVIVTLPIAYHDEEEYYREDEEEIDNQGA